MKRVMYFPSFKSAFDYAYGLRLGNKNLVVTIHESQHPECGTHFVRYGRR